MSKHNLIAIDLAKNVFQICGLNQAQKVVFNRQMNRSQLVDFLHQQEPIDIAMEACYSSHYWGRYIQSMGHRVKLLPAQHVKPFVRGNKSDHNDAIAIAEAAGRPNIIPVPVKSIEQSDIQCLHRLRSRHVSNRTQLINQTRGLLSEYGIIAPQGHKAFLRLLVDVAEPDYPNLSMMIKDQLKAIMAEYHYLNDRIDEMTKLISEVAHQHPLCRILLSIPGIGPINATAIYSAVGNGSQFKSGRELAVWLGLTPRQSSSGNKSTSGGITKRGDRYLRKQLVHGARSVLWRSKTKTDQLNRWAYQVMIRRGAAKASVALAARLARLSWVLLQKQTPYVARK